MKIKFPLNKVTFLDGLIGLRKLPDEFADVILFDPPYNIGKDFGTNFDDLDMDEYIKWCKKWIRTATRVLKDSGTMYIYGFSEILAHICAEVKLKKRWLVWYYTNKNTPHSTFWQRSHESIVVAWKDTEKRIFNLDDVREPYTETFLKNAAGKTRAATKGRFSRTDKTTIYQAHENGALPRDVIKVSALAGGAGRVERFFYCRECNDIGYLPEAHIGHTLIYHPTQKPFNLTIKLLKAVKPATGGVLVVPFAGTGSELLAAKTLGMTTIGFDINEDYVNMANLLIEKGFPQTKLEHED